MRQYEPGRGAQEDYDGGRYDLKMRHAPWPVQEDSRVPERSSDPGPQTI